jgi:pantetheine-phosphate adenylyltransferase
MSRIAVVPGSFDPVTLGHIDVIVRAAKIFDEVHVVVVHNPDKAALLPIAQRVSLIEQSLAELDLAAYPDLLSRIRVTSWSVGLLVDYCVEVGASVIVKGIRSQIDVAYETPMAIVNRNLADVETVFLLPAPANAHVSSSLVRQVAGLGGDVAPYVPAVVAAFLQQG